ncbi:hypothetical protein [Salinibacter altiplanensis]|uniref:hypothetical protein n=1 Tax=Salinibacter altiplanensis TaxID=1803181 RepID=UPI000C9F23AA|nr:hypothetical protein [Salinibacter altiplanensis]
MAKVLNEQPKRWDEPDPYEPLPEWVFTVPVPDAILDSLDALSGSATRLALLMLRRAYSWHEKAQEWRTVPTYWTRSELEDVGEGPGMSAESIRTAARELEARGWISVQEGEQGTAHGYRWRLGVPERCFTKVPTIIFRAHAGLSNSALKVLLTTYRKTWGWTRLEDGETLHKDRAEVSNAEMEDATGLSPKTIRRAARELARVEAIERRRPHRGAAPLYRIPWHGSSFLATHFQKLPTPTNAKENNHNTRRQDSATNGNRSPRSSDVEHIKGGVKWNTDDFDPWQRRALRYWTEEVSIWKRTAIRLTRRRSRYQHNQTRKALEDQDPDHPAGWARKALEDSWFCKKRRYRNPQPKSKRSGGTPIANFFEGLTEEHEGWEWDTENTQQGSARDVGFSHDKWCEAVSSLPPHPGGVEVIGKTDPGLCRFLPDEEAARWAWTFGPDLKDPEAKKWARRFVEVRADYQNKDVEFGK